MSTNPVIHARWINAWRHTRRAQGIPAWCDYSPKAYLRRLAATKQHHLTHPEARREKERKYKNKCREMFGGRIDQDSVAREKWLTWRAEQKKLRIEKQMECRRTARLNKEDLCGSLSS